MLSSSSQWKMVLNPGDRETQLLTLEDVIIRNLLDDQTSRRSLRV